MIELKISKEEQFRRFFEEVDKLIPSQYKSYNAVARAMGIPQNNLHNAKNKKTPLPEIYIYKVCHLMRWNPDYFLGMSDSLTFEGNPITTNEIELRKELVEVRAKFVKLYEQVGKIKKVLNDLDVKLVDD